MIIRNVGIYLHVHRAFIIEKINIDKHKICGKFCLPKKDGGSSLNTGEYDCRKFNVAGH
jgi:hypothetical protein